jgi:hypothetical protein
MIFIDNHSLSNRCSECHKSANCAMEKPILPVYETLLASFG